MQGADFDRAMPGRWGMGSACAVLLLLFAALPSSAAGANGQTTAALSAADRAAIEAALGAGALGAPIHAGPLIAVERRAGLREAVHTYRVFDSLRPEGQVVHLTARLAPDGAGLWRFDEGDGDVLYLRIGADGSLGVVREESRKNRVIVHYDPPQPMLIAGLAPGESRDIGVAVQVRKLDDPGKRLYRGKLTVTFSHLGDYRLTVPAGTFTATLVKAQYRGKVGPARVRDVQYRFFGDGVGLLATVEEKTVSAMLVYQEMSSRAKVLLAER